MTAKLRNVINRLIKSWIIYWVILGFIPFANGSDSFRVNLSPKAIFFIGLKIWHNESGIKVAGLTAWNQGESFASLGIGHFIWLPASAGDYNSQVNRDSFSQLIRYMQKRGVKNIPTWLNRDPIPPCPWSTRTEFIANFTSPKMYELRQFLFRTIPIQMSYLIYRFQQAVPNMLAAASVEHRNTIDHNLRMLMHSPYGLYGLIDYVNFKGDGSFSAKNGRRNDPKVSGLLQVLEEMCLAPDYLTTEEAYVWAARRILIGRTFNADNNNNDARWLYGWLQRVNSYLPAHDNGMRKHH
jgi:hypothetical protein